MPNPIRVDAPFSPPVYRCLARFVVILLCGGLGSALAISGDPATVLTDEPRVEGVRSPEQFFGFAIGSRHLRHDQLVQYWEHLAAVSDRVTLIPYGLTHGRRPLMVAAITSPSNASRLEELRRSRRKLTSGKLEGVPNDAITVMYMGYNVHGDEASAANASPLVAYHLASGMSEEVTRWLDRTVFLVDPALNPDGLDRFTHWVNENRGRFASDSSDDREHNQPWPGGRSNYYWFDLNRDWLPVVHPESQGRIRLFHQWKPNVVLDYHEMSGNSSYFFQPGIPARNNPLAPAENFRLTRAFAEFHSAAMDEAGELFFTEERFDDFYIGKGSTYPDLHGAVGILFEQGSTRALRLTNQRTSRHFKDTVANQVRTSLSSLRAMDHHRDELLRFQVDFFADALASGKSSPHRAFVLLGTPGRIDAAANLLRRHDIQAHRPQEPITLDGATYPEDGTLIIPSAQSQYTLVRSLMERPQHFAENLFYDVSAWHLPSALDLDLRHFDSDLPPSWMPRDDSTRAVAALDRKENAAGYAIDATELSAPKLIARLLRIGAEVRVTTKTMTTVHDGAETVWPHGTFLVLRQPNAKIWVRLLDAMQLAAERDKVRIRPIGSSHTVAGPDLGSDFHRSLSSLNPLLVVGEGTTSGSAGNIWHHLDTRMQHPVTLVDANRVGGITLGDYSCMILPSGGYGAWGTGESEAIASYVRGGGTVIAVGSAASWLARRGLIKLEESASTETSTGDPGSRAKLSEASDGNSARDPSNPQAEPLFADASDLAALETIAGAFFMTRIDPTHPLGYGFPDRDVPVFRDSTLRFLAPNNPYQTAARYTDVIAGYVSERNRERMRGSAAVWMETSGKGSFIVLADNPVFRGYVRSSERFLTNAILVGPGITIPSPPPADR